MTADDKLAVAVLTQGLLLRRRPAVL